MWKWTFTHFQFHCFKTVKFLSVNSRFCLCCQVNIVISTSNISSRSSAPMPCHQSWLQADPANSLLQILISRYCLWLFQFVFFFHLYKISSVKPVMYYYHPPPTINHPVIANHNYMRVRVGHFPDFPGGYTWFPAPKRMIGCIHLSPKMYHYKLKSFTE